jgi:4-hydroxy-2-oxoheptanedioate aldolase
VLLIGPYDLGNNIGHPIITGMDEELEKAIAKIHKAAMDNKKRTGIFCTSGEQARMYADQGFHMASAAPPARFSHC